MESADSSQNQGISGLEDEHGCSDQEGSTQLTKDALRTIHAPFLLVFGSKFSSRLSDILFELCLPDLDVRLRVIFVVSSSFFLDGLGKGTG